MKLGFGAGRRKRLAMTRSPKASSAGTEPAANPVREVKRDAGGVVIAIGSGAGADLDPSAETDSSRAATGSGTGARSGMEADSEGVPAGAAEFFPSSAAAAGLAARLAWLSLTVFCAFSRAGSPFVTICFEVITMLLIVPLAEMRLAGLFCGLSEEDGAGVKSFGAGAGSAGAGFEPHPPAIGGAPVGSSGLASAVARWGAARRAIFWVGVDLVDGHG